MTYKLCANDQQCHSPWVGPSFRKMLPLASAECGAPVASESGARKSCAKVSKWRMWCGEFRGRSGVVFGARI